MITTEQLAAQLSKVPGATGYAWLTPDGRWVTYSEQTTHTGTHKVLGLSANIHDAFVGYRLPTFTSCSEGFPKSIKDLIPIAATAKTARVVNLCHGSLGTVSGNIHDQS